MSPAGTRLKSAFAESMLNLQADADTYVPRLVDNVLHQARELRASDVHLVPRPDGMHMQWRIDGVLHTVAVFGPELAPRLIGRLKVLCGLLTYRTDIPQEGRVSREHSEAEIRVTTFPTLYGEKAAIRLFAERTQLQHLHQLGFDDSLQQQLRLDLDQTSGVIVVCGPSGSGKTTTVYACLRDIVAASTEQTSRDFDATGCGPADESAGTRSVMTLEDPIEVAVAGVTQSQVRPSVGFDLAAGLKSMMRQDPDVILVGEIRDPETAESVFQAALTGHLVITTFHAGNSVEALTRLLEMGIEPYLMRSALRRIVCQRLLRRSCPHCVPASLDPASRNVEESIDISVASKPPQAECKTCGGTGYSGRMVLAESLDPNLPGVARSILQRADSRQLAESAAAEGIRSLRDIAADAVAAGTTTAAEVFRVLGRER